VQTVQSPAAATHCIPLSVVHLHPSAAGTDATQPTARACAAALAGEQETHPFPGGDVAKMKKSRRRRRRRSGHTSTLFCWAPGESTSSSARSGATTLLVAGLNMPCTCQEAGTRHHAEVEQWRYGHRCWLEYLLPLPASAYTNPTPVARVPASTPARSRLSLDAILRGAPGPSHCLVACSQCPPCRRRCPASAAMVSPPSSIYSCKRH